MNTIGSAVIRSLVMMQSFITVAQLSKVVTKFLELRLCQNSEKTVSITAPKIEVYRASEMGCLIYAPDGELEIGTIF